MKYQFFILLAIGLMQGVNAQENFKNSPWYIVADDIDPNNYYGITVANGMVGLVSSPEPMKVQDVVLNGVWDGYQRGRVSNILKTFAHLNMDLEVDGMRINRGNISDYKQTLDMKSAELRTNFEVGDKLSVQTTLMSLRHLPYSSMVVVTLQAHEGIEFNAINEIQAPDHLQDIRNLFSHIDRPHVKIPLMSSVANSPTGKYKLAVSNSIIFPEAHGEEPELVHEDWDYTRHLMKFKRRMHAGEKYQFAIVGSTVSSAHYEDPFNEAERLTIYARLEGVKRLLKRHRDAWAELWKSDIVIDGPVDEARAVRSAIYHLYSFAREGTAYSLSPMGLSGLGYNGHVFWDTEIWMYPPLLMLQPQIAKSLLEYRFERLGAAKDNAFAHGYKGAMYPWESSDDGSEDTPVWALTGPFQHHISGDVAWACWQYYLVTRDQEWLKTRGYPIIKEVANFWTSRVDRNGPGQYDIVNVIGANEWEENIDNNAYTNGMAITVLGYATDAAKTLGVEPDPDWAHVAENIPLLTFEDGTTRENATYDGVPIKQADVNLLAYPMKIISGEENIRRDLAYYEPRMAPDGPAMGQSVLATLYARLGAPEKAHQLFIKSYKANEVPPFGVLAETAGGTNPYFATGAGGMLQAVINGFGGLDITEEGIQQLKTQLPDSWRELKIMGVGQEEKTYQVK